MEVWKSIPGFDGVYDASNIGRIRSIDRYITQTNGIIRFQKGIVLKQRTDKDGYLNVELNKNNSRKFCRVNRLIALTFIPNDDPKNKTQVNHKNEFDKNDNSVSNLEWCTVRENNVYGTRIIRMARAQSKCVYQYSKKLEFIKKWDSLMQVEQQLGFNHSNISACCNGKRKTHKGYIWSYTKLK